MQIPLADANECPQRVRDPSIVPGTVRIGPQSGQEETFEPIKSHL
jgi:hypothetical protein